MVCGAYKPILQTQCSIHLINPWHWGLGFTSNWSSDGKRTAIIGKQPLKQYMPPHQNQPPTQLLIYFITTTHQHSQNYIHQPARLPWQASTPPPPATSFLTLWHYLLTSTSLYLLSPLHLYVSSLLVIIVCSLCSHHSNAHTRCTNAQAMRGVHGLREALHMHFNVCKTATHSHRQLVWWRKQRSTELLTTTSSKWNASTCNLAFKSPFGKYLYIYTYTQPFNNN